MKTRIIIFCLIAINLVFADVPRTLYTVNGSAETLSKMDLETETITQNVADTGQMPNQIIAHNEKLYVLNSGSSSLQIIDPRTDHIQRTIALQPGANPYKMAFAGADKLYISNWVAHTISVVDLESGTITKTLPVHNGPEGIVIADNQAFVCCSGYTGMGAPYGQGYIDIIDIRNDSLTHSLPAPTNPQDGAVAPDGRVHIVCTGDYADISGSVAVIDRFTGEFWNTPAVVDTVDIGGSPGDVEISPAGRGYLSAWGDGTNGFLYSYDAFADTAIQDANDPILIGPNVGNLYFDGRENCLWIPTMAFWGGDGRVQKFDLATETVVYETGVIGNGTQLVTVLEPIWDVTPWADVVVDFIPGAGAGFGQNYFPKNVLGPPAQDANVSAYSPNTSPQEILSLGSGGEIILQFSDNRIVDKDGADFTVFENCFISMLDQQPFIEAGIISVSQNGTDWVTFPYDTSDFSGLAGTTPVQNPFEFMNPDESGGDAFDLADVGLEWATFVKITDLGDIKSEGMFNGDFDLDAVVAVHSEAATPSWVDAQTPETIKLLHNYPNPFNPRTTIRYHVRQAAPVQLTIYDMTGRTVRTLMNARQITGEHEIVWNGADQNGVPVSSGVYLCRLQIGDETQTLKMSLLR